MLLVTVKVITYSSNMVTLLPQMSVHIIKATIMFQQNKTYSGLGCEVRATGTKGSGETVSQDDLCSLNLDIGNCDKE